MNDLGFDIDETDFDAQSRGVGVDAARPILLACFTKLVDEALNYHTRDARREAGGRRTTSGWNSGRTKRSMN